MKQTFSLPKDLVNEIHKHSKQNQTTLSSVVVRALDIYFAFKRIYPEQFIYLDNLIESAIMNKEGK